ncbi:HNH endonuclease [Acaryochloris marina]|uniref:HNH endonuclease n=1 Tax=Acaryochloris marina TaxID=155978 RepID=UPI001BB0C48F|nr:HNH endonuclease [Acaryochloris marina S15]
MNFFKNYINSKKYIEKRLIKFAINRYSSFRSSDEGKSLKLSLYSEQGALCANPNCKCKTKLPIELLEMDHIKPISKYPEFAVDKKNFQLLCSNCNRKKSVKIEIGENR